MAGRELQGGYHPSGLNRRYDLREEQRDLLASGGMAGLMNSSIDSQEIGSDEERIKDWDFEKEEAK